MKNLNKKSFSTVTQLLFFVLFSLSIGACSSQKTTNVGVNTDGKSAQQLLTFARKALKSANYEEAIKRYEALEAKYPLGVYAQQSLLEQAFAYYKYDEPDTALDTIDRFMRMYPNSKRMDYALYLRGLVNFNRGGSIIDKVFPRNFSDFDEVRQKEAFQDFSVLLTRHKNSIYVPDARKRMHYLKNSLGATEANIAKYYLSRGAYLAAFNRADYTIKHHQGTPAIIDALQIKICAAKKLKKDDLANDTMRTLKLNFPNKTRFKCPR